MTTEDEQDIATAMLLGCEFYPHTGKDTGAGWWVHGRYEEKQHPIEVERARPWPNRAELARDYIEFTLESNDGA